MSETTPRNLDHLFNTALGVMVMTRTNAVQVSFSRTRNFCTIQFMTQPRAGTSVSAQNAPGIMVSAGDFDAMMEALFDIQARAEGKEYWTTDRTRVAQGPYSEKERACYFGVMTTPTRGTVQAELIISREKPPVDAMMDQFMNVILCEDHGINGIHQDLNLAKKVANGIRMAYENAQKMSGEGIRKELVGCRFRSMTDEAWEAIWETKIELLDRFKELSADGEFEFLFRPVCDDLEPVDFMGVPGDRG